MCILHVLYAILTYIFTNLQDATGSVSLQDDAKYVLISNLISITKHSNFHSTII